MVARDRVRSRAASTTRLPVAAGTPVLPAGVAQVIRRQHGRAGDEWIAQLPARLDRCSARWSLALESLHASSSSLILAGRSSDRGAVVLKLIIDRAAYESESAALELFQGRGAVTLLGAEPTDCALLLDRIRPGSPLRDLVDAGSDEEATTIAAEVIRGLRGVSPVDARAARIDSGEAPADVRAPVADAGKATDSMGPLVDAGEEAAEALDRCAKRSRDSTGPIPERAIRRARSLLDEAGAGGQDPVVLHGDLHHENILKQGPDAWSVIDPKGKIGDAAYELAALIRNPIDHLSVAPSLDALLGRRIDQLVELSGLHRSSILMWAESMTVVAACWQLEDEGQGWEPWLHVADSIGRVASARSRFPS